MVNKSCETCAHDGGAIHCSGCGDDLKAWVIKPQLAVLPKELLLTNAQIERVAKAAHRKVAMFMYLEDAVSHMSEGIIEELTRIANEED